MDGGGAGEGWSEHVASPVVGVNYTNIHKTHRSRAQKTLGRRSRKKNAIGTLGKHTRGE